MIRVIYLQFPVFSKNMLFKSIEMRFFSCKTDYLFVNASAHAQHQAPVISNQLIHGMVAAYSSGWTHQTVLLLFPKTYTSFDLQLHV